MKKIGKYAHAATRLKDDPLGFLLDLLVLIVANLLIPIPLVGNIGLEFRGFALGCLGFVAIFTLFIFLSIGVVFASPLLFTSGYLQNIFASNNTTAADEEFADTSTPQKNPFGGTGLSYTTTTAYFHDVGYYLTFGKVHTGIDLVPNDTYYQNSKTYKSGGKVVIFSTVSGHARFYIDKEGGATVEVTNNEGTLRVLNIHFSDIYVTTGQEIKAGIPLGVMGQSGFATGNHLHYEVQVKNGASWIAVDPLSYIH